MVIDHNIGRTICALPSLFYIFIPLDGRIYHLCFSFSILSYSEKLLVTFCTSSLPLVYSFSVRNGRESVISVSAVPCLSEPISRKSLTAQACPYVNRLAIGFLAKSMTAFKALRHTTSNKSIAF